MATRIGRSWSFTAVICASLILGALHSAGWAVQEPGRPPTTESQRREAIERLRQQMQRTRPPEAQTPAAPVEAAPPSPPTAPVPEASRIRYSGGQKVTLNFDNLPLYDFVNQVGAILGLTPIVIDSDVRGNVNLVSASPMAREDIFPLFNLILKSKNAALIEQMGIYQIVPISSALKSGVDIIEQLPEPAPGEAPGGQPEGAGAARAILAVPPTVPGPEDSGPRLMTHVIRAEFVPVKDLIEPIKLFMTEGGVIMPYERLNMLIMTDYSDSAAKVLQIIRMLDSSYLDPDLVELVKVENNSSADVAEDLAKIFGGSAKDAATGISFASLDRMNTIFVMASTRRGLEEVKRWIRELDATSGKKFQTFVYVVQNSTASNIAMMVAALFGGEESSSVEMSQTAAGTTQQQGAQGFG
ncbi:MAG: hypothetical protein JXP48_02430, partial [Acidobacteria bacterium]|nr:hypothetical protein [Acidobacteriota bacterium]